MVAPLVTALSDDDAVRIRADLIRLLRQRRVSEPEEIAQEAIFRMLINIERGVVVENPAAYVRQVAQHVLQEDRRGRKRVVPFELEIVAPETAATEEEWLQCLEVCQRRALSRAERKLLKDFDEADAKGREKMAEKIGISRNALGLRVHQIRSKLRACVERCLEEGRTK